MSSTPGTVDVGVSLVKLDRSIGDEKVRANDPEEPGNKQSLGTPKRGTISTLKEVGTIEEDSLKDFLTLVVKTVDGENFHTIVLEHFVKEVSSISVKIKRTV